MASGAQLVIDHGSRRLGEQMSAAPFLASSDVATYTPMIVSCIAAFSSTLAAIVGVRATRSEGVTRTRVEFEKARFDALLSLKKELAGAGYRTKPADFIRTAGRPGGSTGAEFASDIAETFNRLRDILQGYEHYLSAEALKEIKSLAEVAQAPIIAYLEMALTDNGAREGEKLTANQLLQPLMTYIDKVPTIVNGEIADINSFLRGRR